MATWKGREGKGREYKSYGSSYRANHDDQLALKR